MNLHPVIFAGGSGTRLWPLSREFYPKPFLSITGSHTMFQETILRLDGIADMAQPIVVCNEEHRFLVAEQARQIGRMPQSILLEPVGRNTAPALTLAALSLESQAKGDDDPLILAFPADHVIGDVAAFQSAVTVAAQLAQSDCIATLGVTPDSPHTGYGYIRMGSELPHGLPGMNGVAYQLSEFVEKAGRSYCPEYARDRGIPVEQRYVHYENVRLARRDGAIQAGHCSSMPQGIRPAVRRTGYFTDPTQVCSPNVRQTPLTTPSWSA